MAKDKPVDEKPKDAPKAAPKAAKRVIRFQCLFTKGDGRYGDYKIKDGILEVPPAVGSQIVTSKDPRFKKIK